MFAYFPTSQKEALKVIKKLWQKNQLLSAMGERRQYIYRRYCTLWAPISSSYGGLVAFGHQMASKMASKNEVWGAMRPSFLLLWRADGLCPPNLGQSSIACSQESDRQT